MTRRAVVLSLALWGTLATGAHAAQKAVPIQATGVPPTLPAYIGAPATPAPVAGVVAAWQDPFLAPDPFNSVHNDAWQSDAYTQYSGPLGYKPVTRSTGIGRTCITLVFDRQGRLIGSCTNLTDGPGLYLIDRVTLDTLAFQQLPYVPPPAGTNPALNTTGGAYFFLDNHGRVVVAASDRHILVYAVVPGPAFKKVAEYDPTPCLPADERLPSALPDAQGRLWFVGRTHGTVGVLDTKTGKCGSTTLGEEIENSFAVAADGTYVVTDRAMYKLRAGNSLRPHTIWKAVYPNIGTMKVGQINDGSGTTPTLLAPDSHGVTASTKPQFVAITDNADPMDVVVYRAADTVKASRPRLVCKIPVFAQGASATENSLISVGRSLIVENNAGYDLLKFNDVIAGGVAVGGDPGLVSSPGMTRIDINATGTGCFRRWTNTEVRAPSVVPKADTRNGLVYTYENVKDPGAPQSDPWYWTALDYRTGKVVFKQRAGYGGLYNNHYAGIAIGRAPRWGRPSLYVGGVGGIMALRDRAMPPAPSPAVTTPTFTGR